MIENVVEDTNLSVAWARALRRVNESGSEVAPLIVSVTGFDKTGRCVEDATIRNTLDNLLAMAKHQTVDTVANTIFPYSMWNPAAGRAQLFMRYERVRSRVLTSSRENAHGVYFGRMVSGGPPASPNQLEFIIGRYLSRRGFRRSVLQLATFDPARDHSGAAMRGFPCLQHVTFAPTSDGLNLNAFYATQYMVERAYGNYLGLCRLGQFVAYELKLQLRRFTCFTGLALRESKGVTLAKLKPIDAALDAVLAQREAEGAGNEVG
jgi:hypothetical protein